MKRILLSLILILSIASAALAYSNVIYLLVGHTVTVTTSKNAIIVFYQTNIGGNIVEGGKQYACKDVTSCTLSVPGFWVYEVTGTTMSSYTIN